MPMYTYRCPECAAEIDEIRPVDARNNETFCPACKGVMERQIEAPATPVLNPARPVRGRKGGYV